MRRISLYFILLSALALTGLQNETLPRVPDLRQTVALHTLPFGPAHSAESRGIPIRRQARQRSQAVNIAFSLSVSSRTSAGIFQNGVLVRTLWSGQTRAAGSYSLRYEWDGADDAGNQVADGPYQVQVLSNNVTYEWEGVVGNTSANKSGSTVHHSSEGMVYDMVISGTKAYYANGYHERTPTYFKFNLATPQERLYIDSEAGAKAMHCDTDGTNVYWLCEGKPLGANDQPPVNSYVIATKVSDDSYATFSSGTAQQSHLGHDYASAICVQQVTSRTYGLAGIAVQRTGSYLFVANNDAGQLKVLNKTTGALVQTLNHTGIGQIKVDGSDNLWMIKAGGVSRYTVNGDGTLTTANLTLSGLVAPLAIGVAPNGNIAVADGGSSQQVKIYNSSGTLQTTLGTAGGYANGPDVTTNKFYFANTKRPPGGQYNTDETVPFTFITYAPDGSFWVGDTGNCRMLHYSSSNAFVEQVMNLGYLYGVSADANNPNKAYALYLEFAIDYTRPLLPDNGSWTLTKNWSYGVNAAVYDDLFTKFLYVNTLPGSGGRTYAWMRKQTGNCYEFVELTSSGIRYTGVLTPHLLCSLEKNGDIYSLQNTSVGQQAVYQKRTLTGFDGSGNPQYSAAVTVLITPTIAGSDPIEDNIYTGAVTANGSIVSFNTSNYQDGQRGNGYHAGLLKDNAWAARFAPATKRSYQGNFPANGDFDIGNGVGYTAARATAIGSSIFHNYNGEFWKAAQANKYNHFYENGLFIGQFGITRPETIGDAPAMMAGNVKNLPVVQVGSDYYLYHGDESFHGGLHRWKISGLNTIATQTLPFVKAGQPVLPAVEYVNLMESLPTSGTLVSGTGRWTYSPATYNVAFGDAWTADLGLSVYKAGEGSVRFRSAPLTSGLGVREAYCNLGTIGSSVWRLTGAIAYPALDERGDNFLDVLDTNGKVIVRLSRPNVYPTITIQANSAVIVSDNQEALKPVISLSQPLTIRSNGTNIFVKYGPYAEVTTTLFDGTASIASPKTVRVRFDSPATNSEHVLDVENLKLYPN